MGKTSTSIDPFVMANEDRSDVKPPIVVSNPRQKLTHGGKGGSDARLTWALNRFSGKIHEHKGTEESDEEP